MFLKIINFFKQFFLFIHFIFNFDYLKFCFELIKKITIILNYLLKKNVN